MLRIWGHILLFCFMGLCFSGCGQTAISDWAWESVETYGLPTARHEASLVAFEDKLYLMGGRRLNPVEIYDPDTSQWTAASKPPVEIHHFQAVTYGQAIYVIGAMTGQWPHETPLAHVLIYHPKEDRWERGADIPADRRRGGAGAAVYDGKIYLIGGITNGHMDGFKPWLDSFDPQTGEWVLLPDAPQARDHFQAVVSGDKLYAFAGRRTHYREKKSFELTTRFGDVFDLATGKWQPINTAQSLPTERAGAMAFAWNDNIIIGGGESGNQIAAHDEVEVYNTQSQRWHIWPDFNQGRHGSGFAVIGGYLYTASGCGNRGGEPELTTLERLKLPSKDRDLETKQTANRSVFRQWHKIELDFTGPMSAEGALLNPFTDYRLWVTFKNGEQSYRIRGFYAADGEAAETGASSGRIWRVRFSPDKPGLWSYKADFRTGNDVAFSLASEAGDPVLLEDPSGEFLVIPTDKAGTDFRAQGRLVQQGRYFKFGVDGDYWLKAGANSPENLLGYADFDGTYRIQDGSREGEAKVDKRLHEFEPHIGDWRAGDPTWQNDKGKGLIGAMNYLSGQGMNAVYFLTMNILGDGQDVWPYIRPSEFDRFDVSKLAQWEIVFSHMQKKGILLHLVTQETENELMLDAGETGRLRQLYYLELIARFAHHPALVWNLGEENGPAHWRPEGQNTQQRKDMGAFFKANDPYGHSVVLHTHSAASDKDELLTPLLGYQDIDALSFQVAERETVNREIQKWSALSETAEKLWPITMDEIGMWHTGARADEDDPGHDSLREHVLWGALLAGGAGVEWYFGARQKGNDLTTEDWRSRHTLWAQTRQATLFFENYLPYWSMEPCRLANGLYCFAKRGEIYVLYVPKGERAMLDLSAEDGDFDIHWYDPIAGGDLQIGAQDQVTAGGVISLGMPPTDNQDWTALIRLSTE